MPKFVNGIGQGNRPVVRRYQCGILLIFLHIFLLKIFCMTEAVHSAAYNENYKG